MPAKKSTHSPTVVHEGGGIPFFQIFIFLIATVSMAVNFAVITGKIPIQGKQEICRKAGLNLLRFYHIYPVNFTP